MRVVEVFCSNFCADLHLLPLPELVEGGFDRLSHRLLPFPELLH